MAGRSLGVELSLGDDGEVLVRGTTVAAGALAQDGWLHTGDLGRFEEDGRLAIIGRIADTIVTGGENVAPVEVEEVLLEHPAVLDAAVFGTPGPGMGRGVVALVWSHGEPVEPEELRAHCAARLAPFKVPKTFAFAASVPRGVNRANCCAAIAELGVRRWSDADRCDIAGAMPRSSRSSSSRQSRVCRFATSAPTRPAGCWHRPTCGCGSATTAPTTWPG